MNKRQARYHALQSCASLISVNAASDGDLYAGCDGLSDDDLARFQDACEEIATELAKRADAYLRGRRPRRPASLRLGKDY